MGHRLRRRHPDEPRAYSEVLADAISVLSEATRLTNLRVRRTADGGWDPDAEAIAPIDWAEFVCAALAGAAANAGGIETVLAGSPGSWEAARIRDTLTSTVGDDTAELWRHRTEPVEVVIHPERILIGTYSSTWLASYDAAEIELQRRENAIEPHYVHSWPGHELSDDQRRYYADMDIRVIEGPPPEPAAWPSEQEITTALVAEAANPTSETSEEQARQQVLTAIEAVRERLGAQQRAELTDYGRAVAAAVTERLEGLELPVPVSVTVDLDTPWNEAPVPPINGWAVGPVDIATEDAIADTPTPDSLPGTPLERAQS